MWFIIRDKNEHIHRINADKICCISDYYENDDYSVVYVDKIGPIIINRETAQKIFEVMRMSGIAIKKIGD